MFQLFILSLFSYFFMYYVDKFYRLYKSMEITNEIITRFKKIIKMNLKLIEFDDIHYSFFQREHYVILLINKFNESHKYLEMIQKNKKYKKIITYAILYYIFHTLFYEIYPKFIDNIHNHRIFKNNLLFNKQLTIKFEKSIKYDKNDCVSNINLHSKIKTIILDLKIDEILCTLNYNYTNGGKSSSLNTKGCGSFGSLCWYLLKLSGLY